MGMKQKKKKKQRAGFLGHLPTNLNYWINVLRSPENVEAFIKRGDIRQKEEIRAVFKYCKVYEQDIFEELNGKDILGRIKQ